MSATGLTKHQKVLMYFHYNPSMQGADFFAVAFGLACIIGVGLFMKYRSKAKFMFILPGSALLECIGYITRVLSAQNPELGPFVVSVLFVLLAPIILALINYTVVGKLIEPTGKRIGCIKPSVISYVFFASDFIGLIIQAIGGSVLASADTQAAYTLGANIILAGLAIQVGFFTIFTYMMYVAAFGADFRLYDRVDLKTAFNVLFVTTILIYVRNIFRLIEYAAPHDSYIPTQEWLYFVFESTPILVACVIYCGYHFGAILPDDVLQAHGQSKEMSDPRGIQPVSQEDAEVPI
jgi:hypothetical protein